MKAIVQDRYGSADALRLAEIEKPQIAPDEVLVRVRATSVHADVWHVLHRNGRHAAAGAVDEHPLGADHVIDYTREDFTQDSDRYDLTGEPLPSGVPPSAELGREVRLDRSRQLRLGDAPMFRADPAHDGLMTMSAFIEQLPRPTPPMPDKAQSLSLLRELLEQGKLTPHIDRTFPLSQAAEAIAHLQSGTATGKIVLTV